MLSQHKHGRNTQGKTILLKNSNRWWKIPPWTTTHVQQQSKLSYCRKQWLQGSWKKLKSRLLKTPINGERPLHRGSTKPAGRPKGSWLGHVENLVRLIHVANQPLPHIWKPARKHVWSSLPKLQTCWNINPHVFGVCWKVNLTCKIVCLQKNLHHSTKTYSIMSKLRRMILWQLTMLKMQKLLFRKYNMYFLNILRPTKVLVSVYYPCNVWNG